MPNTSLEDAFCRGGLAECYNWACRAGRVLQPDGSIDPGLYVVGWAKRGPTGIIGKPSPHNNAILSTSSDAEPYLTEELQAFEGFFGQ